MRKRNWKRKMRRMRGRRRRKKQYQGELGPRIISVYSAPVVPSLSLPKQELQRVWRKWRSVHEREGEGDGDGAQGHLWHLLLGGNAGQ